MLSIWCADDDNIELFAAQHLRDICIRGASIGGCKLPRSLSRDISNCNQLCIGHLCDGLCMDGSDASAANDSETKFLSHASILSFLASGVPLDALQVAPDHQC